MTNFALFWYTNARNEKTRKALLDSERPVSIEEIIPDTKIFPFLTYIKDIVTYNLGLGDVKLFHFILNPSHEVIKNATMIDHAFQNFQNEINAIVTDGGFEANFETLNLRDLLRGKGKGGDARYEMLATFVENIHPTNDLIPKVIILAEDLAGSRDVYMMDLDMKPGNLHDIANGKNPKHFKLLERIDSEQFIGQEFYGCSPDRPFKFEVGLMMTPQEDSEYSNFFKEALDGFINKSIESCQHAGAVAPGCYNYNISGNITENFGNYVARGLIDCNDQDKHPRNFMITGTELDHEYTSSWAQDIMDIM